MKDLLKSLYFTFSFMLFCAEDAPIWYYILALINMAILVKVLKKW